VEFGLDILELLHLKQIGFGLECLLCFVFVLLLLLLDEFEVVLPVVLRGEAAQFKLPAEPIDRVENVGDRWSLLSAFEDHSAIYFSNLNFKD